DEPIIVSSVNDGSLDVKESSSEEIGDKLLLDEDGSAGSICGTLPKTYNETF
ncbi:3556_t:CDS:1, partial [Dentiscutata heterogama]